MEFDTVYVDMDGVLCDLFHSILSMHDRMDLYNQLPTSDLSAELGMSDADVWAPVVEAGPEWWATIPAYPWAHKLMAFAKSIGDATILTRQLEGTHMADGLDVGNSVRGKTIWLRKHFGNDFMDVVFTGKKHCVSRPGALLIDDTEAYEDPFNAKGGRMVVFPQSYNRYHTMVGDPVAAVEAQYQHFTTYGG
jgi:5'(3')-deoxyribonucleotidase